MADAAADQLAGGTLDRSHPEQFSYQACRIILASNTIRGPLIARYLDIGRTDCVPRANFPQSQFTTADWNRFIECNNNSNTEARDLTLHIIRLNKATCRSIQELERSVITAWATEAYETGGSNMGSFGTHLDPDCDYSQPAEVWRAFIQNRR